MKVKELKEQLAKVDDNIEVIVEYGGNIFPVRKTFTEKIYFKYDMEGCYDVDESWYKNEFVIQVSFI